MKLKLIACKSMTRELSYLSALSDNLVDITYMRQGYHEQPDMLREKLQAEIDSIDGGQDSHTNQVAVGGKMGTPQAQKDFDAILLGYGLCSNGIAGLHSEKHTLVIPRGHDCMTLFLGSKERYMEYFKTLPGCFWYTGSWIENSTMPGKDADEQQRNYLLEQGYDEDMLDDYMDVINEWQQNYHYAAYIRMPFYDLDRWQKFTSDAAEYLGWEYKMIDGDMSLFERFISGQWDEESFLLVPPGYRVIATNDEKIIGCEKIEPES